jgi:thioredoxin 2
MNTNNTYIVRCSRCFTKNRIPSAHIDQVGKCGRCGEAIHMQPLLAGKAEMLNDQDFETRMLRSPLPALMFCWAPWCPTCRTVLPYMDEMAAGWKGKLRVAKVNIDQTPMIANRFQVRSVPFIYMFDRGQLIDSFPGGMRKLELMQKVSGYLYA